MMLALARPAALTAAATGALALPGCVAMNSVDACRISRLAEIPVEVMGGVMIADVSVNGRAARLVVDTGATQTVLTEAAVARLGIGYDLNSTATATGAAGVTIARLSQPVSIMLGGGALGGGALGGRTFGGVALKPTPIIAIPSATMLDNGIDGLLGVDPLANYDLDVDLPKRMLGVYAPRRCPDGPAPFGGPATVYRTSPNPYQFLYMPARVDGKALSLVVDTGASNTFLSQRKLGLPETSAAGDQTVRATSSGPGIVAARMHRFRSVSVGDAALRDTGVVVGSMPADLDGLLGNDYWRKRRVWLSFAGWTVTVQTPTGE